MIDEAFRFDSREQGLGDLGGQSRPVDGIESEHAGHPVGGRRRSPMERVGELGPIEGALGKIGERSVEFVADDSLEAVAGRVPC